MKTIFKTISVILTVVSFSMISCEADISLEPLTFSETNTAASRAQLMSQLAGIYNVIETEQGGGLGLYSHALWGYLTANTDESFRTDAATGSTTQVLTESYRAATSDASYFAFWKQCYIGIERANVLLQVADQPKDISDEDRKDIIGQAKFLRAYYFYLLVSNFGDVPLKIIPSRELGTNFNIARTPAKEVYNFVIKEMTEAETLVKPISKTGLTTLVSKSAVQGMLARVCLTMAGNPINDKLKYKDALDWAQKVINSGLHDLNYTTVQPLQFIGLPTLADSPAYSRVFINNMQNTVTWAGGNSEQIWDAAFLSKSNTSGTFANTGFPATQQLGALMGIQTTGTVTNIVGTSAGTYRVLPTLYKRYQVGDLRRDWAIAPFRYTGTSTAPLRSSLITVDYVIRGTGTNTGTGATATASIDPLTGKLASIVLTNGGANFTTNTSITATATPAPVSGSGATFTYTVNSTTKVITGIAISNAGSGYPMIYDRSVGKWRREYEINVPPSRSATITSCNFPILRYADILLMAAEADLQVNGGTPSSIAVGYYNKVRRRAFGYTPSSGSVPAGVEVTTFTMNDLMDERSRELCFEGQRRNDLLRWGNMETAMQNLLSENAIAPTTYTAAVNIAANNFLTNPQKFSVFPIPFSEFTYNNELTQNAGW